MVRTSRVVALAGAGLAGIALANAAEAPRDALFFENMVRSSRGLGGPQPSEVARMLKAQEERLAADQSWLAGRRKALADSAAALDAAFNALRN